MKIMMKINKYRGLILFGIIALIAGAGYVYANPIILYQSAKFPGTATTTRATLTPGTGTTTTLVFDSYQRVQGTTGGDATLPLEAHLAVQMFASSTNSSVDYRFEYSQDNQDWYSENEILSLNATNTA